MEMVPRFGAEEHSKSIMSGKRTRARIAARSPANSARATNRGSETRPGPPQIPGRWLLAAVISTIAAAALCAWGVLCLLFWQGSWQLLYHPSASVQQTPASAGLTFDAVGFAVTDEGRPRLKGWWIPAAPDARFNRYTVLVLHGQDGNLGDTVESIRRLHSSGVNVLAFDYRGYGQSQFARPSEASWRQDAEWALRYLTETRHIPANTIVLDGEELGANLALEVAAAHPELAGVIVESPTAEPIDPILSDARARLVPARLLVRDRFDLSTAAAEVKGPVLWIQPPMHDEESAAYARVATRKILVWVNPEMNIDAQIANSLTRWLDELPTR
jgi:pimeloyl-ACP methyl ester carboxylesterase